MCVTARQFYAPAQPSYNFRADHPLPELALPDIERLIRPSITRLKPYVPGKPIEEVQRELGLTDIVKMASNENCLGPSPKALDAIANAARDLWLYPDASCCALKNALASFHGLTPAHFATGTGSDEILHLISIAFFNAEIGRAHV